MEVYNTDWKEQENIRSKLFMEIKKDMISFCQQSEDERCKEFLKYTMNNIFEHVLKNF